MSSHQQESVDPALLATARKIDAQLPRGTRLPRQLGVANRIRRGETDAFAGLCDALLDRLLNYAYYRIGDHGAAQAFVQTMCLHAWGRRQELHAVGSCSSLWLLQVCREQLLYLYDDRYEVHDTVRTGDRLLPLVRGLDPVYQEWLIVRRWLNLRRGDAAMLMGLEPEHALFVQACAFTALKKRVALAA